MLQTVKLNCFYIENNSLNKIPYLSYLFFLSDDTNANMFSVRELGPQKLRVPQTTETTSITFKILQHFNSGTSPVGSFTVWTFTAILCQK